eukprot:2215639-Pyramimonas_sp.AAC.1
MLFALRDVVREVGGIYRLCALLVTNQVFQDDDDQPETHLFREIILERVTFAICALTYGNLHIPSLCRLLTHTASSLPTRSDTPHTPPRSVRIRMQVPAQLHVLQCIIELQLPGIDGRIDRNRQLYSLPHV